MLATRRPAVNGRKRKRSAVLRPGIVAACRESGRSRWHVTEVLRGNRQPSTYLKRILKAHGLEAE